MEDRGLPFDSSRAVGAVSAPEPAFAVEDGAGDPGGLVTDEPGHETGLSFLVLIICLFRRR